MTMKTLIDAVADRTGETKARTAVTVEAVFTEIAAQLAAGNDVTLPGFDHVGHFRSRISDDCSTSTIGSRRCTTGACGRSPCTARSRRRRSGRCRGDHG